MPIYKIEVSEFECIHCGYKWINRVNGKEGFIPKKCAKCKRAFWNGKGGGTGYHPITPYERGLRMRLYKFGGRLNRCLGAGREYRPNELCKKFLSLNPRPTLEELKEALWPLGWDPHRHRNYIPNPENPKYLKYDTSRWIKDPTGEMKWNDEPDFVSDYDKLLEDEQQRRTDFMKKVIESRGETVPVEKTKAELEEEERREHERFSQLVEKYEILRQKQIGRKTKEAGNNKLD